MQIHSPGYVARALYGEFHTACFPFFAKQDLGMRLQLSCSLFLVVVLVLWCDQGEADVYLHNPRGSNDRLNETDVNRNNANRLFDSQNNAKGGYAWGPSMYFHAGSRLSIEWTNQHSCADPKARCQIILQYTCSEKEVFSAECVTHEEERLTIMPDRGTSWLARLDGPRWRDNEEHSRELG